MLVVKDLSVIYDQHHLGLDQVSVRFEPATITGIIGPNGAGKSTFMKAVLGLIAHTGQVSVSGYSNHSIQGMVAYVPQKHQLDQRFPMTVRDCVSLGRYQKGGLWKRLTQTDWAVVDQALEQVALSALAHRPIHALSGGQFQRMLVARCLVQESDYLFLDEPFVGIDAVSEQVIMEILWQLRNQGKTIVVVHHDLSKLETYFDRLMFLDKTLIAYGKINELPISELLEETFGRRLPFRKGL